MVDADLAEQTQGSQRNGFSSIIAKGMSAMVVAAVVLAVVSLYSVTVESDSVSVERQARAARHAIYMSVDDLALEQETVAVWDDAASHLMPVARDIGWIHDNIGGWLHKIFGHDEVFILDAADRAIYAAVAGRQVATGRFGELQAELMQLVVSLRGRDGHRAARHDRLPGQPLPANTAARTTSRTAHDSHLVLLGERPAAVSAMLVRSSTPGYVRPVGAPPVLISVRYLDRSFLTKLAARELIAAPRFSRSPAVHPGEHATAIEGDRVGLIGYLVWRPDLPGSAILSRVLPWTVLSLLAIAMFVSILGLRLRRAVGKMAVAEQQAAHLAFHDSLTQLPNRALFQRRLDELTSDPSGAARPFALALIDVDDFKLVNDTMGHDAGDLLLVTLAERLKQCTSETDLVARLGGDEFALLLVGVGGSEPVESLARKLLARVREPWDCRGKMLDCHVSIGASIHRAGDSGQEILKQADLALYEAKRSGQDTYRLYEPGMWSSILLRQRMLTNARESIERKLIRAYYQPKVDLQSGAIVGFEALLRCCWPGRRPLGPEHLEAAFEDPALAVELSQQMLSQVIDDVARWRDADLAFGHVAINASAAELRRGDYSSRLLGRLERADVPPECIQVEVTEGVLLGRGIDHVERAFQELASSGIKLALDDFGTGFASLSHLKQFPVEIIKIDRSFIRDLQIDPEDGAIVDALIGLAAALRIGVVAEGIETSAQRDFLAALGCTLGQGYLFGKPMPADRVAELLRKQGRTTRQAA